jgi:hypothetical protein
MRRSEYLSAARSKHRRAAAGSSASTPAVPVVELLLSRYLRIKARRSSPDRSPTPVGRRQCRVFPASATAPSARRLPAVLSSTPIPTGAEPLWPPRPQAPCPPSKLWPGSPSPTTDQREAISLGVEAGTRNRTEAVIDDGGRPITSSSGHHSHLEPIAPGDGDRRRMRRNFRRRSHAGFIFVEKPG